MFLALAISAVFAALSQWQLDRAVQTAQVPDHNTEEVVPLTSILAPNKTITTKAGGRMVTVTGEYVPGDEQILIDRDNEGARGFWVVSRFALTESNATNRPVVLAVARGWAATQADAQRVADRLAADQPAAPVTLTGRLMPAEAPIEPEKGEDPHTMRAMSVAHLINVWPGIEGSDVYTAYVIDSKAPEGLEEIYAPPPVDDVSLNWLNIFYAIEWVVFAGFAVFLWYRLVRDAKERESELRELALSEAAPKTAPATPVGSTHRVGSVD